MVRSDDGGEPNSRSPQRDSGEPDVGGGKVTQAERVRRVVDQVTESLAGPSGDSPTPADAAVAEIVSQLPGSSAGSGANVSNEVVAEILQELKDLGER